jgi:hypothetical protein
MGRLCGCRRLSLLTAADALRDAADALERASLTQDEEPT